MSMILIQAQVEEPRPFIPRKGHRSSMGLPALVVHLSQRHSAKLLNLSSGGARIESTVTVREADQIMLTCGDIEVRGRVAWTREGQFGVEFHAPLDETLIFQQICRSSALTDRISMRDSSKVQPIR